MNGSNADIKRQAILDALACVDTLTTSEVMAAIGLPKTNTATFLGELMRKGRIRKMANYDGSREARWALALDTAQNLDNRAPVVGDALPQKT